MKVRIPKREAVLLYLPDDAPDSESVRTALLGENIPF